MSPKRPSKPRPRKPRARGDALPSRIQETSQPSTPRPLDHVSVLLETAALSPEKRLGVILQFLRADVSRMDEAEREAWSWRLRAFTPRPSEAVEWASEVGYEPMDAKELESLRETLQHGLTELLFKPASGQAARAWGMPGRRADARLRRDADGGFIWTWALPAPEIFVYGVAQLIAYHGEHLRACRRCDTPFVAVKRQEFCTSKCGQLARDEAKAPRKTGGH